MIPWGPREYGTLIGSILTIVLSGWHFNNRSTNKITDKITELTRRLLTVEETLKETVNDQSSIRDRASRTESRVDMLYIIIGKASSDPYPDSLEDRRRRTENNNFRRRRSDFIDAPRGEDEDDR